MDKTIIKLGILLGTVVTIGISAEYYLFYFTSEKYISLGWMALSLTLAVSMVVCLFGILALPGGREDDGGFKEQRIRLSIAVTLIVVYLVLFSNAVFFGVEDKSINKDMMNTLTQLMTIVLPFYFGTSGLVEWSKRKKGKGV